MVNNTMMTMMMMMTVYSLFVGRSVVYDLGSKACDDISQACVHTAYAMLVRLQTTFNDQATCCRKETAIDAA